MNHIPRSTTTLLLTREHLIHTDTSIHTYSVHVHAPATDTGREPCDSLVSRGALFPCSRIPCGWWIFRTNGHDGICIDSRWRHSKATGADALLPRARQTVPAHQISFFQAKHQDPEIPRILWKVIYKGCSRKKLQRGGCAQSLPPVTTVEGMKICGYLIYLFG